MNQGFIQTPKLHQQYLHIVAAAVATVQIAKSMGANLLISWGVFCEVCGRKKEKGKTVCMI